MRLPSTHRLSLHKSLYETSFPLRHIAISSDNAKKPRGGRNYILPPLGFFALSLEMAIWRKGKEVS
jgi:hypothetical protein